MLTPEQLKEIEERCNKATEGPWKVVEKENGRLVIYSGPSNPYSEFIVAARQDIPLLIEEIRRLNQQK